MLDKEILEILKAMQNQMSGIQDQMNGMQNQMNGMQNQMNGMQGQMNGMQGQMNEMQDHMNGMHVDIGLIKDTQKEHGEKLDVLLKFEKNTQFVHERIDTRLSKIDNRLRVLAEEDFDIKTDIIGVKEELKVIRGGKE